MTHHMNIYVRQPMAILMLMSQIQPSSNIMFNVAMLRPIMRKLIIFVTIGLFEPAGPIKHLLKQTIRELVIGSRPYPYASSSSYTLNSDHSSSI